MMLVLPILVTNDADDFTIICPRLIAYVCLLWISYSFCYFYNKQIYKRNNTYISDRNMFYYLHDRSLDLMKIFLL